MTTVLIVSRTRMNKGVCVGAIIETTREVIRIHDEHGANLTKEAEYQIGERWEVDVQPAWNGRNKPHVEDTQVLSPKRINDIDMQGLIAFIKSKCNIIKGTIYELFSGTLVSVNCGLSTMYINGQNVPDHSVAFWIADKDLVKREETFKDQKKIFYVYDSSKKIRYVGFQQAIDVIPQGTIIRMSLANWWDTNGTTEKRCYLQLSGWYL